MNTFYKYLLAWQVLNWEIRFYFPNICQKNKDKIAMLSLTTTKKTPVGSVTISFHGIGLSPVCHVCASVWYRTRLVISIK